MNRFGPRVLIDSIFFCLLFTVRSAISEEPDEFAKIACLVPLTGAYQEAGRTLHRSYHLGWRTSRPSDVRVVLLTFDTRSDPAVAESLAISLANQRNVILLVGGFPSSSAYRIARIAETFRLPYLIDAASGDSLSAEDREWIFRIAPPASEQNEGLVGWAMTTIGNRKPLAIVGSESTSAAPAIDDLERDLNRVWRGRVDRIRFAPGLEDFTPLLSLLKPQKPAAVWLFGETADIARFLRQARSERFMPFAFLLGTTGLASYRLIALSEGTSSWIFAPVIWTADDPRPAAQEFLRHWRPGRKGDDPDPLAALGYAAMEVVGDVLTHSGGEERSLIRKALAETSLRTAVGPVEFTDFPGYYNQNRMQTSAMQLRSGTWSVVWPRVLASARAVYPVPDWRERERAVRRDNVRDRISLAMVAVTALLLVLIMVRRRRMGP
ncbi:MAG: ABC transporter substrate-binding protein [Calditrichaeota bacterium]|nr:ABC transporter substrate-binding protein [Calditrichota bacterium]